MKPTRVAFLVACCLISGCGGAPQQAPSSAPYAAGAEGQAQQQPSSTATAGQQSYGVTADKESQRSMQAPKAGAVYPRSDEEHRDYAQPPPPLSPSESSMSRPMRMLADDLVVAESAMLTAGHDCTSACRALRSMQRAAARLCSIAATDDEREVCRRAQERVRGARERVRSSCGQCTGGPSLEPNAPIEE